jgi:hypothetical protein
MLKQQIQRMNGMMAFNPERNRLHSNDSSFDPVRLHSAQRATENGVFRTDSRQFENLLK